MNPTQKQFSQNRGASRKQIPISKILQIFNRYLEYGGEEGSVGRIEHVLHDIFQIDIFYNSTEEQLQRPFGKWRMPGWMICNQQILDQLRKTQELLKYDVWLIHNVFPAMSVKVYELAAELDVRVIQYLHNYRFGCAAATCFRDEKICQDCNPNNFKPAIKHRCWRGSLPATWAMTRALRYFWDNELHSCINAYIAISEKQKQIHVEWGIPAEKIFVIRHFLDASGGLTSIPPEQGDILFLGRLVKEKGVELLIKAWSMTERSGRILRIVGDGPEMSALRNLVQQLQLTDVVFEGFVPHSEQAAHWAKASFVVAPSVWYEPFGMVVLEAWKNNRPILTTNIGSFPEMINHEVNGWLAPTTPAEFAHVLQDAINASSFYQVMGNNGRMELQEKYNTKEWIRAFDAVYTKILPQ